jgi:outer membrane protein assembly factor BamE (lipoprotein component of BamABCDE complex)
MMLAKAKSRGERNALRRFCANRAILGSLALTGCLAMAPPANAGFFDDNVIHRGYVFDEQTISQVRVGTAAEQVLILLGTPSTTSTIGGDAWYYISQKVDQPLPFMPARVTDQHIYAVYFDKGKKVSRIGNYGIDDGKVVDFSSRQTVTGGGENRLIQTMIKQMGNFQMKF